MKKIFLLLAFFTLVFSACKKDSFDAAKQAAEDDAKIQAYIKANNIEAVKDASGLYYQILTTGTGVNPTAASTVRVAYVGKLLDGTQFDTSTNFSSSLSGSLIQGWKIGLPYCKQGGRILLLIPSGLGYGNTAQGSIPKNSVLVFTIDLIQVQG